ncbi:MAG: hypothetical protein NC924_05785 [Candidatus Omnitrophica bacterium]|nr:hypothetical protein [Candidatus Omnitrophota bacterium]
MKHRWLRSCAGILLIFGQLNAWGAAEPNRVRVSGERGGWELQVNGQPFYIKGVGCGYAVGSGGEDYLKMAQEIGANCVRTWGIDQGTKDYLDKAASYGLMVDAGIWLNVPDAAKKITYVGHSDFIEAMRAEALAYIQEFKSHPAILMWNVGNEVLIFTKDEQEKIAFCRFLELLVQEIQRIDPDHPVVYTDAAQVNLPYLKKYVPSLNIIGMNIYGSVRAAQGGWESVQIDRPYLITEFGPQLPMYSGRDRNGQARELGDYQKAIIYRRLAEQVIEFKGCNLGGFAFHLGETTQESMTWWNLNEHARKRQSFWSIYEVYTGKSAPCAAPKIHELTLSKERAIKPGEDITVSVRASLTTGTAARYLYRVSTSEEGILQYYVNSYVPVEVKGEGPAVAISAPQNPGIYRVYCFIDDGRGNVSSVNKSIRVD